jgi:histidinol dehydrogenase
MPDAQPSIRRIRWDRDNAEAALAELRAKLSPQGDVVSDAGRQRTIDVFGEPLTPRQVVARIAGDVLSDGLAAVLDYSRRIDRAEITPETLRVTADELAAAHAQASPELLGTVRRIRDNVLAFQQAIRHEDKRVELPGGGYLAQRYRPLRRVGICVPGGAAAYPSTVLMTAVPAQAAGVEQLAVVAPPTKFGSYNTDLLATCHELGIREVYRLGGAQAVAAMAYGVEGLEPVDKIVGPGNLFVALAKQHVFGRVDIDSISGPSEVVVLADETAPADWVAADMIAQAEHSPGSSVLVTWHEPLFEAVDAALTKQLASAERGDLAMASLIAFGGLILARDAEEACRITASFAPEHLHIQTADPEAMLAQIPTAGAAFLGPFSPVAVGDYVAGPSHVLPTSGTARFGHGLSCNDFLRPHSVIAYSADNLLACAEDLERLATAEGLDAHWQSVAIRLDAARGK